jgi:TetR/AcrR family transcriptional regulator, repressor for uid operon
MIAFPIQEHSVRKSANKQIPKDTDPTRARLLKAATQLFLRNGYASVSVRDLAAACGLTTGAIYSRFRNKTEMLVSAIETRMDSDLDRSSDEDQPAILVGVTKRGELERVLLEIMEQYPRRAALRALLIEGACAARRDPEVREGLRAEQLEHVNRWIDIYRGWQHSQGIDPNVDIEAVLMFMWAAELGLGVLEAYGMQPPKPRAWRRVIDRLLQSLQR